MTAHGNAKKKRRRSSPTALVLAGGGAHGAYEVGALQYIHEEILNGDGSPFDVFTGTSAGALNTCSMAATADDPAFGIRELVSYWRSVTMERLLRFGSREMARLPNVILGRRLGIETLGARKRPKRRAYGPPHPPVSGIFDTSPLYEDMTRRIPWERLDQNIRTGVIRGAAVCATEVCTSKSIIFHQTHREGTYHAGKDAAKEERPVRLDVQHAMASAAIPFLFPAVQIDGICYMDGAFRQNLPLSPAIRMGADRLLLIGLSREPKIKYRTSRLSCQRNPFPGSLFLLGRTVRAVMDGILDHELHRVEMFNHLIRQGQATYGDSFLETLNRATRKYRNADYRPIDVLQIRPSRTLNDLAVEALKEAADEVLLPGVPGRLVKTVMTSSPFIESELSSYLMFTPTYVDKLIRLGYEDARRQHDEIAAFLLGSNPRNRRRGS